MHLRKQSQQQEGKLEPLRITALEHHRPDSWPLVALVCCGARNSDRKRNVRNVVTWGWAGLVCPEVTYAMWTVEFEQPHHAIVCRGTMLQSGVGLAILWEQVLWDH